MIKSFSGQVVFCFAILEPYLLTLAKTDYPSIVLWTRKFCSWAHCNGKQRGPGSISPKL